MRKTNLMLLVIAIVITLSSCKKELPNPSINSTKNAIENISADLTTTENGVYGNWLTFDSRDEYVEKVGDISSIFSTSNNPDSVLNEFDSMMGFTSLRQYHNDTTEISSEKDTVCYISSPVFSSVLNRYGIYEIDDTIYVETPNNTYKITDGDDEKLDAIMTYFNDVEVESSSLPEGVEVTRIYKSGSGISKEEAIELNSGYDYSFTRADHHTINGKRYKTVAVVNDFSRGNYTIYGLETKYEIGKKSFGKWYYTPTNAHWLYLYAQSDYYAQFRYFSIPKYFGINVTRYDLTRIYVEAYSYYHDIRSAHPTIYVEYLMSTHKSHIHSTTKTIEIFESGF